MNPRSWQFRLGMVLVALSVIVYFAHYLVFRDMHHIFIYLLGDVAFVPVEVLLVTLVIHQLLGQRERRSRLAKLNMVIGAFFTEVGTELIARISDADPDLDEIRASLVVTASWDEADYRSALANLRARDYRISLAKMDLVELRAFLASHKTFLLNLLTNPNLLEHESFTELMQAVFHLVEELSEREVISESPETDLRHLGGDVQRVYARIVGAWLDYLRHLQENYPYLFSLAIRTNPFDRSASPIVR